MNLRVDSASVLIVDNFFEDPEMVRQSALRADFKKVGGALRYRNSEVPLNLEKMGLNKLSAYLDKDSIAKFEGSGFRCYLKRDQEANLKRRAWIHFDRFNWIAIVFLNRIYRSGSGTTFFTHKKTNSSNWLEYCKKIGNSDKKKKKLFGQLSDFSKWYKNISVEMKYNRLIIFDPRNFHQASSYFGDGVETGRLTLNFHFDEVTDEEYGRRRDNSI